MSRDDAELLARAGRGDQSAFATLYHEYESDLYRYSLYLADGPDAAEELFQETWFRAVKHIGHKPIRNFKQWLFTIATNLYRDELRKRKVRRFVPLGESGEGDYRVPESDAVPAAPLSNPSADDFALREALNAAVNTLTPKQRTAFVLVYVQGLKIREAGEVLGKPEGTVKSALYRALEALRAQLEEFR